MLCPKCNKKIEDNSLVCRYCNKVLALECPNCKNITQNAVCDKCGYIILEKCAKCGKLTPTVNEKCKCGYPVKKSLAYQECECDEFASMIINFESLSKIKKNLKSQELYAKFKYRLRNLLNSQLVNFEGKIIYFDNACTINFNKELSFQTSANKAVRLALKIFNSFVNLNKNIIEEFDIPLNLTIYIIKKEAENILVNETINNNIKLLNVRKTNKNFLKGMQLLHDQYVEDCIAKDYKTDSLFSLEKDDKVIMYYEVKLENYILPPSEQIEDTVVTTELPSVQNQQNSSQKNSDIYSFKVFDINAKCKFKQSTAQNFFADYDNNKIVAVRAPKLYGIDLSDFRKYFKAKNIKVLHAICREEVNYRPWGIFEQLFRDYYGLSLHNSFISDEQKQNKFPNLFNLLYAKPRSAATHEDARFAYMEDFERFLKSLKNCVVIIEDFEFIDDTTVQLLELYFDKFKHININFIFITDKEVPLHSKIKGLLRTTLYTEYSLVGINIEDFLSSVKEDASDFIQSFYHEKIKDNFNNSLMYCNNAIKYLTEKNILITFENKLIIRSKASVVLPVDINGLIKARLKLLSKDNNASLLLAYSVFLGPRLDFGLLEALGVNSVKDTASQLEHSGWLSVQDNFVYINNYNLLAGVMRSSFKKEIEEFLLKNILSKLGKGLDMITTAFIFGNLSLFKDEYLLLWKNSQFTMSVGDYDSYLKNSLAFLSLINNIKSNISDEDIQNHKKEVFQNILMGLYAYSPQKIYSIEKILLLDAINSGDNQNIVKLSNLMLQGALISSNYTDAQNLLHNILSNMQNPELIVDDKINTKFLLLSLINIEILFNVGEYEACIDVANQIITVITPDTIEQIKPVNFSVNLFVNHLIETFRLVFFAKLFTQSDNFDEFFDTVKNAIGEDLPDKEAIITLKEYLQGKDYVPSQVEHATPFSKIIYLFLQEFSENKDNPKVFAQNIYQAKLLASDINQYQIEMFCDLLIAYAYSKIGIHQKAESIYRDILTKAEQSSMYNILMLVKYFDALNKFKNNEVEEALIIINDSITSLKKSKNTIIFVLFEKLLLEIINDNNNTTYDIESEQCKLEQASENLQRLL